MGETNEAVKDAKPGVTSVTPSTPQAGTTSTPQTFTREQVDKEISDRLAAAGREAKKLEREKAELASGQTELKTWREEQARKAKEAEDAELEDAVANLPEAEKGKKKASLQSVQERIRNESKAFNDLKSKHAPTLAVLEELGITDAESLRQAITSARETSFSMTVSTIAERNNVSAELLKDKAAKLKVTDEVGINELALVMPKKAAPGTPDSGKNVGGGGIDFKNMSPAEKIRYGQEHPEAKMN